MADEEEPVNFGGNQNAVDTQTEETSRDAQTQDDITEPKKSKPVTKDGTTETKEPCDCAPRSVCTCESKPTKKQKPKDEEEGAPLEEKESPCTCAPKTVCKCKRKPGKRKSKGDEMEIDPRCKNTNPTKDPCHKCDPEFKKRKPPEEIDDPFMMMFDDQEPTEKVMLTKMTVDDAEIVKGLCHKVTVLGSGLTSMSCILSLLTQHITSNIVVFDTNLSKAIPEIMDLQSATVYLNNAQIFATDDIEDTTNSRVVIVGPDFGNLNQTDDISSAKGNYGELKNVIPNIIKKSPNCAIINAAYPYDMMTYAVWKLATSAVAGFSSNRTMGLGNAVASARLRFLVGCQLDISPASCRALIIGETGPTSVPIWSSVTAGAVRLQDINPRAGYSDDPETWHELGKEAAEIDAQVRSWKKAEPCWASGIILANVTRSILHNTMECYALSTYVKGCRHGQDKDVFMSLPCIIGARGVIQISKQPLGEWERESLQATATYFHESVQTMQEGSQDQGATDGDTGKPPEATEAGDGQTESATPKAGETENETTQETETPAAEEVPE